MPLEVIEGESEAAYHAKRGEYLTSSNIKDYMDCPAKFIDNLRFDNSRSSPAMDFGTAFHCRLLEGVEAFSERYFTGGPVNPRTGAVYGSETKAYAEWVEANSQGGKRPISPNDFSLIGRMVESVYANADAKRLLDACVKREVTIRGEYFGLNLQARLDACVWDGIAVVTDIKTCDSLNGFERDIATRGYFIQLGLYGMLLGCIANMEAGAPAKQFIIAVEKSAPNRCAVWSMHADGVDNAILDAIHGIIESRKTGNYPHKYTGMRTFELKPWMSAQWGIGKREETDEWVG